MVGRVLEYAPPTTFRHTQVLTMRDDPLTVVSRPFRFLMPATTRSANVTVPDQIEP